MYSFYMQCVCLRVVLYVCIQYRLILIDCQLPSFSSKGLFGTIYNDFKRVRLLNHFKWFELFLTTFKIREYTSFINVSILVLYFRQHIALQAEHF